MNNLDLFRKNIIRISGEHQYYYDEKCYKVYINKIIKTDIEHNQHLFEIIGRITYFKIPVFMELCISSDRNKWEVFHIPENEYDFNNFVLDFQGSILDELDTVDLGGIEFNFEYHREKYL